MKTLDSFIAAHLDDDPYIGCHLIELQGATTHRWTDYTSDLVYGGNTYTHATPFTLSEIVTDADGQQACTLTFDDELQQILAYDDSEGMKDRVVIIYEAWVDPATKTTVGGVDLLLKGRTAGIEHDTSDAERQVAILNISAAQFALNGIGPREKHVVTCVNEYKGARCGYVGGLTTCDFTFAGANGCTAHSNQHRFRGCRWAIMPPKTIFFGGYGVVIDGRS